MFANTRAVTPMWLRTLLLATPLFVATATAANPRADALFTTVGCDSVDLDGLLSDAVDYALAAMSSISAISEGVVDHTTLPGWDDLKMAYLLWGIDFDDVDGGRKVVDGDLPHLAMIRSE
jgi:hypothetical protein